MKNVLFAKDSVPELYQSENKAKEVISAVSFIFNSGGYAYETQSENFGLLMEKYHHGF